LDGLEKGQDERVAIWKDRCDEVLAMVDNYRMMTQALLDRVVGLTRQLELSRERERKLVEELRVERVR
jgi:hypothetical protein